MLLWPDIWPPNIRPIILPDTTYTGYPDTRHPAGYLVIRPAGYSVNETGNSARYQISKKALYPVSRISGTTLVESSSWHVLKGLLTSDVDPDLVESAPF